MVALDMGVILMRAGQGAPQLLPIYTHPVGWCKSRIHRGTAGVVI
ncbi:hypothetical protein [Pararhodobacter sp. CCB-MM2]|nr:hypothetical protein [Pararhodobacter sp. CCB-MM2]